jgi:hypothetical protein
MRIISVCLCVVALAMATPARANDATTSTSTKCFHIPIKRDARDIPGRTLLPSDAGFKSLRTQFGYGIRLKGKQYKQYVTGSKNYYWFFEPQRFAIGGNGTVQTGGLTVASAGGNPSGQALGSVTVVRLFSTKASASYDLSSPWSGGLSWESSNKIRKVTNAAWSNTGISMKSGTLSWDKPLAGRTTGTGLYQISVQTAVAAGGDGPFYFTPNSTWALPKSYRSARNAPSPLFADLFPAPCDSVKWGG